MKKGAAVRCNSKLSK